MEQADRKPRGPYMRTEARPEREPGRPSDVLAANVRAYRMLRSLTQDGLAALMASLGHGWTRSTVSAVEWRSRNVTVDELFGLALSLGVSISQIVDPAGPDRSRRLGLDVGVRVPGSETPETLAPALAHLWSSGRAVLRLRSGDGASIEVEMHDDAEAAAGSRQPA
jgi:transcriptional regulator with XRE-family HTH domain